MAEQEKWERVLVSTARTEEGVKNLEKNIDELRRDLKNNYVRKGSFEPVQRIVYGIVGVIVMAVITALVALVVTGGV